eukprot:356064-Chlamydomonas_euryale.AAC.4
MEENAAHDCNASSCNRGNVWLFKAVAESSQHQERELAWLSLIGNHVCPQSWADVHACMHALVTLRTPAYQAHAPCLTSASQTRSPTQASRECYLRVRCITRVVVST